MISTSNEVKKMSYLSCVEEALKVALATGLEASAALKVQVTQLADICNHTLADKGVYPC